MKNALILLFLLWGISFQAHAKLIQRIYLLHGYGADNQVFLQEPFKAWIEDLKSKGFEIVTFDLPTPQREFFYFDGGKAYGEFYIAKLKYTKTAYEIANGKADKNILGGISYGGYLALMGIEKTNDLFDAYFASMPVVEVGALEELSGVSNTQFHPESDLNTLAKTPGFIQWGTKDERVNYRFTLKLVEELQSINAHLTAKDAGPIEHISTPETLSNITKWLTNIP
jgi:predicted esterase